MRRLLLLLCTILFLLAGTAFFVVLNLNAAVSSQEKVREIMKNGKFYDLSAVYIKEEVIRNSGLALDEGSNFERINGEVNAETVKPAIDQALKDFYLAIDANDPDLTFHISLNTSSGLTFSKLVNLHNNLGFLFLRISTLLVLLFAVIGIMFLSLILLFSKTLRQRLQFIGWSLVVTALILGGLFFFLTYAESSFYEIFIKNTDFFNDPRLLNGLRKVIAALFKAQRLYYLFEAIILVVVGSISLFLAKALSREKLEKIGEKI